MVVGGWLLAALLASTAAAQSPQIVSLRIQGVVDPFVANYVAGGIEEAVEDDAPAVLITIDTPGGLDSSMRKITQAILNSPVPVITYVSPSGGRAASAGAFILITGSVAAMAPGTNVGAAHPVGVSGIIEQQKVLEDAVAYIRSLAEARGRNADWAEEAVRDARSSSAEEALSLGVIDLVEPDVPSLLQAIDGREVPVADGETATMEVTGATLSERGLGFVAGLLHSLFSPDLAFIFFWLGIALVVLEVLTPGLGVAGVLGGLMLIAAFVSFGMLPVQLIGVVLLVGSVVFFLLELKFPGLGFHTAAGVVALVLGGMFLFDASVPGARVSPAVIIPIALLVTAFFVFVVRSALRLRHMPPRLDKRELVGSEGIAHTALAPQGVVLVESEEWTAESIAGAIPKGARVRVVGAAGLRLKVEPADARVTAEPPGSGLP